MLTFVEHGQGERQLQRPGIQVVRLLLGLSLAVAAQFRRIARGTEVDDRTIGKTHAIAIGRVDAGGEAGNLAEQAGDAGKLLVFLAVAEEGDQRGGSSATTSARGRSLAFITTAMIGSRASRVGSGARSSTALPSRNPPLAS